MTIFKSTLLKREGFGHGFGTNRSMQSDFPLDVHLLLQVHGEKIVVLTENASAFADVFRAASADRGRRTQAAGEGLELITQSGQLNSSGIWNLESGIGGSGTDIKLSKLPPSPFRFDEGDAMVCDIPGVSMGIRTADCLPLLIVDRLKGTAAAVHCGWRSLALGLAGKAVRVLTGITGNSGKYFLAAIGPSIGSCCYEVGEEVREAFGGVQGQEGLFEQRDDRLYLDLASGVKTQLIMEGMTPETIDEIVGCTSCNPDLFWSWRARKEEERMVSFITVREPY